MELIALELRKLGLKPKEVSVYLAGLELGWSPVQKIARKAEISRPTAYEIIRGLKRQGLMREIKRHGIIKGEKTYFAAESPDKLLGLLRVQKREIEEKEREFVRIISALRSRFYLTGQNEIRTFEGKEEMKTLLEDFSQSRTDEILILGGSRGTLKPWQEKFPEIKKRLGGLKIKEVKNSQNFKGTLIIYDKLVYLPSSERALLIGNEEMVEMIKNLIK